MSPSALATVQTCQLRLAFQRDNDTRIWSRSGTGAALGIVAHRLTELTLSGEAPPPAQRRSWLTDQWQALLHIQWVSIQAQWPDRTVDAPKHWPGEAATRVRLIRRLEGLPARAPRVPGRAPSAAWPGPKPAGNRADAGMPAFPWIERKLHDDDRELLGQPDRVEEVDGLLRVVDLKSGVRQEEITPSQRQQLLLYAHLVKVEAGRLPEQVVIQSVRGTEQACPVSSDAVSAVVNEAILARDEFNSSLRYGFLASPSADQCGFCPFRVICADYWDARQDDWPGNAVRGRVVEISNDGVHLDLPQIPGFSARLIGEGLDDLAVGEELVAVDLERAGPGAFRTRWNSALRHASQKS